MAVVVVNASCTAASGTLSSPDTKLNECFLQNKQTNNQIPATSITYPGKDQWSASFTGAPAANYKCCAIGDHMGMGSKDVSC